MKFEIKDIPLDIQDKMIEKKVWASECIISLTKLKLLTLSHYNFDNRIEIGQMVALGSMADSVIAIFQELFALKFPIHTIKLVDEFEGDDELSMSANNSSCFNFRKIAGTNKLSLHAYGLAIDINPMQNPFIQNGKILPANGKDFIDRSKVKAGMIEPVVEVFYKYGFTEWGGNWQEPIDYHHFQVPRQQIEAFLAQCN